MRNDTQRTTDALPLDRTRDALDRIQTALRGLKFGTVTAAATSSTERKATPSKAGTGW